MIDFFKNGGQLVMRYATEQGNADWLVERLKSPDDIALSGRTLHVRREILLPEVDEDDDEMEVRYQFVVGRLDGEYYQMDRRFLGINYDLFMHRDVDFRRGVFVAEKNIPIFRGFNVYGFLSLHVGGDHPEALPMKVFERMLQQFPNSYELKRYAEARVSGMIRSYVPIKRDHEAEFRRYRERKASAIGSQPTEVFGAYEGEKFSVLVRKIEEMLAAADAYTEAQWQVEVLQVIQLLYPKYVVALPEAPVRDSLAKKDRKVDFLLVDATGYVDAIEIKKPFLDCVVSTVCYRDNYVPLRELSGAIMQLEKYLYHLNRWGQVGEARLNKKYTKELSESIRIKIVNPSGMIIMGRDEGLTQDQRTDFEVIRRKYRHVVDIMTYDDLLRRLKLIQQRFERQSQG